MAVKKWIETKREFEVDENGISNLSKTTSELDNFRRKDILDFFLKTLPLLGILASLIIFFKQQNNELQRQTRLFKIETYINTTTTIRAMVTKIDKEFFIAKDELYSKLYPRIKFINDKSVINKVDTIITYINLYSILLKHHEDIDSLINKFYSMIEFKDSSKNGVSEYVRRHKEELNDIMISLSNRKISSEFRDSTFKNTMLFLNDSLYNQCADEANDMSDYINCIMPKASTLIEKRNIVRKNILALNIELDSLITMELNLNDN
ncbi:MAG TPA: hypothetical protein VK498_10945 [Ferruginibacter sp.]|nr:hypothetical protein [Ferruginibacter sp.]